jgi:hypothetical protein
MRGSSFDNMNPNGNVNTDQDYRNGAEVEYGPGASLSIDEGGVTASGNRKGDGGDPPKKDKESESKYNNRALKGALAVTTGLVVDDATVVGVVDDVLIPFVEGGAAALWTWDNKVLLAKQAIEIKNILSKSLKPTGFTYELRVNQSGNYIDVRGNKVSLNSGDVWKYGETSSATDRYSRSELNTMVPGGVYMEPIFFGNQVETKVQEKIMIYGYTLMNGSLPPGNKIFR